MNVDDIPDEVLYLGVVIMSWVATAFAWYDNHSDFGETLAIFMTILAIFATILFLMGIFRLYKIHN